MGLMTLQVNVKNKIKNERTNLEQWNTELVGFVSFSALVIGVSEFFLCPP